jgi:formamidopyrimidine-DNA glycosylase
MPELPEVETTTRRIHAATVGSRIKSVEVLWERTVHHPACNVFRRQIKDRTIQSVFRRGKFVIFSLSQDTEPLYLLAHMRMSGHFKLVYSGGKSTGNVAHMRVIFHLDKRKDLLFCDARKFGRLYLVSNFEEVTHNLGLEPLADAFNSKILFQLSHSRNMRMKAFLLNQSIIAGVGNIYADEALWHAGIHPARKSGSLSLTESRRLFRALRSVLRAAIHQNGTDFGDGVVCGNFKPSVYGREGENCPRCRTTLVKLRVMQRGTHICPYCQR